MGCAFSKCKKLSNDIEDLEYKKQVSDKALQKAKYHNSRLTNDYNRLVQDNKMLNIDISIKCEQIILNNNNILERNKIMLEHKYEIKKYKRLLRVYDKTLKTDVQATINAIMTGSLLKYMDDSIEREYLKNILTTVHAMVNE
jgi:hypothetical protein